MEKRSMGIAAAQSCSSNAKTKEDKPEVCRIREVCTPILIGKNVKNSKEESCPSCGFGSAIIPR
jgi:hypothetical protein